MPQATPVFLQHFRVLMRSSGSLKTGFGSVSSCSRIDYVLNLGKTRPRGTWLSYIRERFFKIF
jgi:hypothetical protein